MLDGQGAAIGQVYHCGRRNLLRLALWVAVGIKESAAKQDYAKTIIIDLKGNNADLAKTIAEKISAEVDILPDGETAPEGDVLIILGSDRL